MKPLIAIVAGGDSSEHDVSMRSAEGILSFMDKEKFDAYVVEIKAGQWTAHYDREECAVDRNDFSFNAQDGHHQFDFAYITIHGTPGEDGILQGYFDLISLPYSTSDVLVEALTFNKFALNNFLRAYPNLHVSDSVLVRKGDDISTALEQQLVERLGIPCFVKPNAGGSSFGVTKVKRPDALRAAIEKAMVESDEVMIEKLMTGTEITCGAYLRPDGEVYTFPITEVVTSQEFFDYDAKYNGQVEEITPARLAPETAQKVAELTSRIYDILHANGIIRVDYIISKDQQGNDVVNMLEVNTTPGMTATSFIPQQVRAAGLDISQVLSEVVENQF